MENLPRFCLPMDDNKENIIGNSANIIGNSVNIIGNSANIIGNSTNTMNINKISDVKCKT